MTARPQPRVIELDAPVPIKRGSRLMVVGVMTDSPSRLIQEYLELGRIEHESLHIEPSYEHAA